ncbi:MAG: DEAD/DEAH box helicase [Planctomycetota bacterium]
MLAPGGRLHVEPAAADDGLPAGPLAERIAAAFAQGSGHGLLHLGTREQGESDASLPPDFRFFRDFAARFVARLCASPELEERYPDLELTPPTDELTALAAAAPPFPGAEYLDTAVLGQLWTEALRAFREEIAAFAGTVQDWLRQRSAAWHLVGRVHFHLAERKDDARRPFAFLATYTTRLGAGSRAQHRPLGQAVADSAQARDKQALLALLQPVHRAAERDAFVKGLLDGGEILHPLAWTPDEAWRFLQAIPACEAAGVVVRVPDWWRSKSPPRPQVRVTIGGAQPANVGLDALLDFDVAVTLGGERLSAAELSELLASTGGLVRLRGQWVELDKDLLRDALAHWQRVRASAGEDGLSLLDGMRLLAGAPSAAGEIAAPDASVRWSEVRAGAWLENLLATLRDPAARAVAAQPVGLAATLRPYQATGVAWLSLLTKLGLGACLADDMGLGKTVQVLALLLARRRSGPSLLIAPASLLANWQAEIERFAPSLVTFVAHASATDAATLGKPPRDLAQKDLVLTTYGSTLRLPWLTDVAWDLVVLDEAQAIKNAGSNQARACSKLRARARIALTGTPIENRLGDLWSLFHFLNPGLLGSATEFGRFVKTLERRVPSDYGPLRALVSPYILRRLKSDRRVIADLPDKTEVRAWCNLTKPQAALYAQAVQALAAEIGAVAGIERRGAVLAFLMRFKQICNHPSQWLGDGVFAPDASGKFARLGEICESIAARQEKVLVFTQFQELTEPLQAQLATVFGRPGVVLDGTTPLAERKRRVERFQNDDAVPFFVLSVKAGGTGLNLTAATHVIHFDRWWNPAVEDQATDRAYRIGQRRNVLVHKFVCHGTVEERIDALIEGKRELAGGVLGTDGGKMLTEMSDAELLRFVALDVHRATGDL